MNNIETPAAPRNTEEQRARHDPRMRCRTPSPCWAVFITKAWGRKIEERQISILLSKAAAQAFMSTMRRMEASYSMGKRFRIRRSNGN